MDSGHDWITAAITAGAGSLVAVVGGIVRMVIRRRADTEDAERREAITEKQALRTRISELERLLDERFGEERRQYQRGPDRRQHQKKETD